MAYPTGLPAKDYNHPDMTPENLQASEPTPAGMSEFSRIAGVFFEPAQTFEDIAARPRWLVPLLLILAMTLAFSVTFSQHVGWERMMRQQLEASPRAAQLSAEQKEQQIAMMARFAPIFGVAGPIIVIPVFALVESAV